MMRAKTLSLRLLPAPLNLQLGQIIATKTDMLGPVYTEVLGTLHDQMPYVPVKQVRRLLTK